MKKIIAAVASAFIAPAFAADVTLSGSGSSTPGQQRYYTSEIDLLLLLERQQKLQTGLVSVLQLN